MSRFLSSKETHRWGSVTYLRPVVDLENLWTTPRSPPPLRLEEDQERAQFGSQKLLVTPPPPSKIEDAKPKSKVVSVPLPKTMKASTVSKRQPLPRTSLASEALLKHICVQARKVEALEAQPCTRSKMRALSCAKQELGRLQTSLARLEESDDEEEDDAVDLR